MATTDTVQNGQMETVTLSIPSAPRLLRVVRCMMAEVAELTGFASKERDKICLAVDEACANIIRHSYKGRTDGQIIIKCKLESGKITINIRDFGEKFDFTRVHPPEPEGVKPGGLGIHMIRSVMDKVECDTSHDAGTEIHMTKYVHPQEIRNGSEHQARGQRGGDRRRRRR